MTLYFPARGDVQGNVTLVAYGSEGGDLTIPGTFNVSGPTVFRTDVEMQGNLTLHSSSTVDVLSSTVYNFGDPTLDLNTLFTGTYVDSSGLRIYRGSGINRAQLLFSEDPTRTTLEWRIGTNTNMLRVGRVPDAMTDRHAIYWDDATGTLSSHPNIVLNAGSIDSSVPSAFDLPAGSSGSYYRYNAVANPSFSVERYSAGVLADSIQQGFKTYTYNGETFTGAAVLSSEATLLLSVRTPTSLRNRYLLEGVAALGIDDATTASLHTDLATMRVEGASAVQLRAGTSGTAQLAVTSTGITANQPLSMGANIIDGDESDFYTINYTRLYCAPPTGFELVPVIGGWGGDITYDGVTSTVGWADLQNRMTLEYYITYSIVGGDGSLLVIYAPIDLNGNMENLCSVKGMAFLMSGATAQRGYCIPTGSFSVEEPFDVDPPTLTAATLAGYYLLSIQTMKLTGDWKLHLTIELDGTPGP